MVYNKTVYATSKALSHRESVEQLRAGQQPYPIHVELIISDFCNHDCGFCAYRMSGYTSNELFQIDEGQSRKARNPRRMIPKEKCFEILDDCKAMGVKAIQFTGGGEPTIHPDFCSIVGYAQSLGFDTALITNGNMLVDSEQRALIRNMAWVRVSVDAAEPTYYMAERGVAMGAWDRLREGVLDLRDDLKGVEDGPVVGAGFVVTPGNWKQMHNACRLFMNWGFHNVRLGLMFNPDGADIFQKFRDSMDILAKSCVEDFDSDDFRVISRVTEKLGELDQGAPDFEFCGYQHYTTYIGGDLNLYRCCVYAYNEHGLMGSMVGQGFKELWDSQAKQDDFSAFDPHACKYCQFSEINTTINAAVKDKDMPLPDEQPPHVNFV